MFILLRMPNALTLLFLLVVAIVGSSTSSPLRGESRLPIFDAHVHYNAPAWQAFDPAYVQELLDRAHVTSALVSSTPDDGTLRLYKTNKKRFLPELRPYRDSVNAGNWTRDPTVLDYIKRRLDKAPYLGIGEIHIYKVSDVDWDVVAQVAGLARERNIFLHVHSEAPAIKRIFELEPEVTILWAHAGFYDKADTIGRMLDRHERLYAELSLRAPNIMPELADDIAPDWKAVLLRHQDRMVIGSDTYINLAWAEYDEVIGAHRRWLRRLPRDVAEKIAHTNAERLFERPSTD